MATVLRALREGLEETLTVTRLGVRGPDDVRRILDFQLEFMARNPRRVLSRDLLLSRVWEQEFGVETNVVDVRDVAKGHIRAAERGRTGERYVLGGHDTRWVELFERVAVSDITWRRTLPWRVALAHDWPEVGRCTELAVKGPAADAHLLARREILREDVVVVVVVDRVGVEHIEDVHSYGDAAILEPDVLRELEVEQRVDQQGLVAIGNQAGVAPAPARPCDR
jgi:hypothetical protein